MYVERVSGFFWGGGGGYVCRHGQKFLRRVVCVERVRGFSAYMCIACVHQVELEQMRRQLKEERLERSKSDAKVMQVRVPPLCQCVSFTS